jgi:hypothetical protein
MTLILLPQLGLVRAHKDPTFSTRKLEEMLSTLPLISS